MQWRRNRRYLCPKDEQKYINIEKFIRIMGIMGYHRRYRIDSREEKTQRLKDIQVEQIEQFKMEITGNKWQERQRSKDEIRDKMFIESNKT